MKNKTKLFVLALTALFLLGGAMSALVTNSVQLTGQTVVSSSPVAGTFNAVFNISSNADCSSAIETDSTVLTTDGIGRWSYYFDTTVTSPNQLYIGFAITNATYEETGCARYSPVAYTVATIPSNIYSLDGVNVSPSGAGIIFEGGAGPYMFANGIGQLEFDGDFVQIFPTSTGSTEGFSIYNAVSGSVPIFSVDNTGFGKIKIEPDGGEITDLFRINNDLGANLFSVSSLTPAPPGGGVLFGTPVDMGARSIFNTRQLMGRESTSFIINTGVASGSAERNITLQTSNRNSLFASNVNRMTLTSGNTTDERIYFHTGTDYGGNNITNIAKLAFDGTSLTLSDNDVRIDGGNFIIGTVNGILFGGQIAGDELILRGSTASTTPSMSIEDSTDITFQLEDGSTESFIIQDNAITPNLLFRVSEISKEVLSAENFLAEKNITTTENIVMFDDFKILMNNDQNKYLTFNGSSDQFEFNDNILTNGFFLGDGSQLTNISTGSSEWTLTGTVLQPNAFLTTVFVNDLNVSNTLVFNQSGIYLNNTWNLSSKTGNPEFGIDNTQYGKIVATSQQFNVQGGGTASRAQNSGTPSILFDDTTNESSRYAWKVPNDIDLSVNPRIEIVIAPRVTQSVGSNFVFETQLRYYGDGEAVDKALDQALTTSFIVSNTANIINTTFVTLDSSLISADDQIGMILLRAASDINDDRNGDAAVINARFVYKKLRASEVL